MDTMNVYLLNQDLTIKNTVSDVLVVETDSNADIRLSDTKYSIFFNRKLHSLSLPIITSNIHQTVIRVGNNYFYVVMGEYGPTSHIFPSMYEGFFISKDEANILNVFDT